jgi:isoleucyl-tRNA synthetase
MSDLNKMTEEQVYEFWTNNNIFYKSIESNNSKPTYTFLDGPPFLNAPKMHYGHILAGMIKDSVLRYFHNKGMNVPRYNGADCIAEGTLINLADGTSIPVEHFENFDARVDTFDLDKKGMIYQNKTNFFNKGEKECIELTFLDGSKLTCTPDHKIYTENGWIEAKNLKINETKIIKSHNTNPPSLNLLNNYNWEFTAGEIKLSCNDLNEKRISMAYCRILGYMLANGCLFYNGSKKKKTMVSYVYFGHEYDAINCACDVELVCGSKLSHKYSRSLYVIDLPTKLVNSFMSLEGIPIGKQINQDKLIPEFIKRNETPIFLKQEFLAGLFGGDGHTVYLKKYLHGYTFSQCKFSQSKSNEKKEYLKTIFDEIIVMMNQLGVKNVYYNELYETTILKTNPADKIYELTLFVPKDSMIDFGNIIGFRYCLNKSIKLGIGLSYLNYDKNKIQKKNDCEKWLKNTNSYEIMLKKYAIEKDNLLIPYFNTTIISVKNVGIKKVYDITIDNTHNFIASGIVVHNCHGLPIEFEIEKELGIKTTQQVKEFGIGNYNEACRGIVLRYADEWEKQMGRLGRWVDFKNQYKTMDLSFMNSVWWVFKNLYDKGRIYEGVRIMGYSTSCGTPLSNFEIQQNYKEVQDDSLFIKLPLVFNNNQSIDLTNTYILVWTTTPWTLPSNYALCVGESVDYVQIELEGNKYICGEKLIGGIFGKKVPTILNKFKGSELVGLEYTGPFDFVGNFIGLLSGTNDNYSHKIIGGNFVTDSDGTGIVHLAPSYGTDDYQVCLDNGLITKETKLFQPLDLNGFVDNTIPELKGMFYKNFKDKTNMDLNTWVVIELKKRGYYWDKRTIKHNYPFCWRSDTPLIYRAVNSWFIKVEDMRDKLVELNGHINWVPKSIGEARFANWLGAAKDWGISRNRFWGTPIPIWKSDSGDIICVGSSYELERLAGLEPGSITDLHSHLIDHIKIVKDGQIYQRISEVMDCWLESGAMPYGTVGRVGIVELLEKHCKLPDSGLKFDSDSNPYILTDNYICNDDQIEPVREKFPILPADFIAEGLDQTRGWFYTLLVLSASLFGIIPFKNVIVNGLILAEDGKKMSKRLKNYPDPMYVVKEYGSDALRLYLLESQATRAEPLKFSKSGVHGVMKDIIIPLTNTIIFWKEYMELYLNTHKTNPIISIKNSIQKISNPINLWILRKYSGLRDEFNTHMEQYNLKNAVGVLYKLVEIMNNGYVKMGRQLIKGKESEEDWVQSLSVLSYLIGFILNDFKSIIPFFAESQYQYLRNFYVGRLGLTDCFDESVHLVEKQDFVKLSPEQIAQSIDFDIIYNIITQIYQLRSLNDISLKKPVKQVNLIWDEELESRYSSRFKNYLSMVSDECNLLDIKILSKSDVNISKTISPVKGFFFKKYGKDIGTTFDNLNKMDSGELESILLDEEYNGFKIDPSLFNQSYNVELSNSQIDLKDLVCREFNFGEYKDKIIILMDKSWTESNDRIYYYRLVATSIQKSRKNAGLHPWDVINALWEGQAKFTLESNEAIEYIENITRIKLLSYQNNMENIQNKSSKLIYSSDFDNIGIKIHLAK